MPHPGPDIAGAPRSLLPSGTGSYKHRAFALEGRGTWHALSLGVVQQVVGPVRARVDVRCALDPTLHRHPRVRSHLSYSHNPYAHLPCSHLSFVNLYYSQIPCAHLPYSHIPCVNLSYSQNPCAHLPCSQIPCINWPCWRIPCATLPYSQTPCVNSPCSQMRCVNLPLQPNSLCPLVL